MAGTRNSIARWRRIKHVMMVLCVQSVVLWVATCGTTTQFNTQREVTAYVAGGGVTIDNDDYFFDPSDPVSVNFEINWMLPRLLPAWGEAALPQLAPRAFAILLPLWPIPVAFGALAWYANTRITRLRQGACTKCGYDTRGLAAGAPCPECGAACSV
jgi:hypothetical protein